MDLEDFIKHREIVFDPMHPDCDQAQTAALSLADVPGISQVQVISPTALRVSYDLASISLMQIDEALDEAGFHLSNKLFCKLRRALYYFTEENQRANAGCPLSLMRQSAIGIRHLSSFGRRQSAIGITDYV